MKRTSIILSMLVVVGILVGGCAPAATQAPSTPETIIQTVEVPVESTVIVKEQVEITSTPAPSKVSGTIRVGSWDSGDALIPFNAAIESFKAQYPDVNVELESVPQGYGDKLLTQFAAGNAPDVFQVGDGDAAKFAGQGVLEPLDDYISGAQGDNPLDMSVFFPAVADIGKVGDSYYLLTKDYSPLVIFYNKTLFDQAGVEYPAENWTWEDMRAAAIALTQRDAAGNTTVFGIQLPDTWGDVLWYRGLSPLIYQNGGAIISPDGTTTQGFMNSPETVEAVQFYVDLFMKDKVAPTKTDIDALAGVDLFQTGMAAMAWTGRWPLADFKKNPQLNFGTAPLPMKGEHANSICWAGFAMYSSSPNKDAAWAFLKHIGAGEGAEEFAKYAFTAVQPIAELQGLATDPYNAPIVKDLAYVKPLPEFSTPKFGECAETFFKQELEKVFLEGKAVQAAMDDAAEQADACLAKP